MALEDRTFRTSNQNKTKLLIRLLFREVKCSNCQK